MARSIAMTRFTAEQAGITAGWGPASGFSYNPYGDGHTIRVVRSHIDGLVLAAFADPRPVEVAFDAVGLLVFGLCWRFTSVTHETWEGTLYSYHHDPPHWLVLALADARLVPVSARTIRLELCDKSGAVAAERRVLAPPMWAFLLGKQVAASAEAHNWRDWYKRGCETLLHTYPTPGDLARTVQLQPGGPGLVNPKAPQHCLAIPLEVRDERP
jgi:hypothetical protein